MVPSKQSNNEKEYVIVVNDVSPGIQRYFQSGLLCAANTCGDGGFQSAIVQPHNISTSEALGSSRHKMFKEGLISRHMPPEEYEAVRKAVLDREEEEEKSKTTTYKMEPISEEESKKLAKILTDDHPTTVYGMIMNSENFKTQIPSGYKITSQKIKSITNEKCDMKITLCSGDLCEMKFATYKFNPPIKSSKEVLAEDGKRLQEIHNQVCSPKIHWLITDPLALIILITFIGLTYGTIFLGGVDGIVNAISSKGVPRLEEGISTLFTSTKVFSYFVVGSFWFCIIAHGIEAGISYQICNQILQLDSNPTVTWMFLVFLVGYPIFSRLQAYAQTQQKDDKTK